MMNARSIEQALTGVCILGFLGAVLFVLIQLMGCTPAVQDQLALNAENAAAVAQYDLALVECQQAARQKPREQRFEAYTDCEQAVSKHFCSESRELRREWKRCAELGLGEDQ